MVAVPKPYWRLLPVIAVASGCCAQAPTATLTGRVYGPGLDAVAGAAATVRSADRSERLQTITDDKGRFAFAAILAGVYQLTLEKEGFRETVEQVVSAERNAEIEIALQPELSGDAASIRQAIQRRLWRHSNVGEVRFLYETMRSTCCA